MKEITTKNDCHNVCRITLKGDAIKKLLKRSIAAITALSMMTLGLMLAGCGGGSGGVSSEVVSGTAAVGAPLSGQVSLKDSSSPSIQKTTVIGSDGSFGFDVTGMKAPFILQADGSASGKNYRLHSFAEGTGTANVNPLSDALVASAYEDDDTEELYRNPDLAKLEKIKYKMQIAVSELMEQIRPLLIKFHAEGKNPIKDDFKADHRGLDGVFDNITITILNGTLTITNRTTGAVIFTASIKDIRHGHFTDNDDDLPQPPAMPVAPVDVTTLGGTGQVTLSWNAVSNATAYNVYFATTPAVTTANGTTIANASSPYVQSGLAVGTTYYYIVTAVNSAGEGAASAQASAMTTASQPVPAVPAIPAGVIATGGTNQVTLSWSTVSNATSYNVYYSTSSGVTKTNGTKIPNAATPAVLGSLTTGTTYYYIVTAANTTGESAASVQVAATTLAAVPNPAAPAIPIGVTAAGGDNQATITWPVASGATSYNVYWSTATGVTKTSGTKVAGVTSPYIKTGLSAGTTYYFVVTAVNTVGEGAASAEVTATTTAAPVLDGLALYNANCASCHGTSKLGKSATATQGAIASNTGGMGFLSNLTTAQIAAVASTTAPAPTPVLDGAALYNANCAGCHGTSKRGKTVAATQGAIASDRGGMGYLSTLTAAELTAISLY